MQLLSRLYFRISIFAIVIIVVLTPELSAQIPTDSLVAWYPFNGNANDSSGKGNNGTPTGVAFVNGGQGIFAQFTSTSYIEVADNASFDFSNAPGVTIETWVRQEQATNGYIIMKMGTAGLIDDEYALNILSDGTPQGAFYNVQITSISKLTLNTWYNVVLIWDQTTGNISLYINGVLDHTISSSITSIQNTTVPLRIGKILHSGSNGFIGSLHEVRIYNRALSESEIDTLNHEGGWNGGTRRPVIIIPGIMGSPLYDDQDNDNFLNFSFERVWAKLFGLIYELWLDDTGEHPLNPADIIKTAPLRYGSESIDKSKELSWEPLSTYEGLVKELTNTFNGYKLENFDNDYSSPNSLYILTYDWRLKISGSADSLAQLINNVCSGSGCPNVDIVAHSMGGLVVKEYIRHYGNSKIRKVIFIATPHEGSPMAINSIINGVDFKWWENFLSGIKKKNSLKLAHNSPAVYELMPTARFNGLTGLSSNGFLYVNDRLTNRCKPLGFAPTLNYLTSAREPNGDYDFNSTLLDKAVTIFQPGLNDSLAGKPNVFNIVGYSDPTKIYNTIGALYYDISDLGNTMIPTAWVDGDGTVPLPSATYVSNTKITADFYVKGVEHQYLPSNPSVCKIIGGLLNDPSITSYTDSIVSMTPPTSVAQKTRQITIGCPVTLEAFDQFGNHTGPTSDSTWEENIPGSRYIPANILDPESQKTILLPEEGNFSLKIKSQDTTASFRFDEISIGEEGIKNISTFDSIGIEPKTEVTCDLNTDTVLTLIRDLNGDGQKDTIRNPIITNVVTSVNNSEVGIDLPKEYLLSQNYPNPFNPSTTIRYTLPNRSHVILTIYNTLGQQICILVDGDINAGFHEVHFDGNNLASGIYFYRLQAGSFNQTKKLLLLK